MLIVLHSAHYVETLDELLAVVAQVFGLEFTLAFDVCRYQSHLGSEILQLFRPCLVGCDRFDGANLEFDLKRRVFNNFGHFLIQVLFDCSRIRIFLLIQVSYLRLFLFNVIHVNSIVQLLFSDPSLQIFNARNKAIESHQETKDRVLEFFTQHLIIGDYLDVELIDPSLLIPFFGLFAVFESRNDFRFDIILFVWGILLVSKYNRILRDHGLFIHDHISASLDGQGYLLLVLQTSPLTDHP